MAKQVKTTASLIYVVCITCLVFIFVKLTIFEFFKKTILYIWNNNFNMTDWLTVHVLRGDLRMCLHKCVTIIRILDWHYLRNQTYLPVFYHRIKYRYEFGCVWTKLCVLAKDDI